MPSTCLTHEMTAVSHSAHMSSHHWSRWRMAAVAGTAALGSIVSVTRFAVKQQDIKSKNCFLFTPFFLSCPSLPVMFFLLFSKPHVHDTPPTHFLCITATNENSSLRGKERPLSAKNSTEMIFVVMVSIDHVN